MENFVYDTIGHSGLQRDPHLGSTYLAPGARVKGHLTFQLPIGSVPGRVSFTSGSRVADFAIPSEDAQPVSS